MRMDISRLTASGSLACEQECQAGIGLRQRAIADDQLISDPVIGRDCKGVATERISAARRVRVELRIEIAPWLLSAHVPLPADAVIEGSTIAERDEPGNDVDLLTPAVNETVTGRGVPLTVRRI